MGNEASKKGLSKSETNDLAKKTQFTHQEIEQLKLEFNKIVATTKVKELNMAQFKSLLKGKVQGTDDQLGGLFQLFDSDGSGSVSFNELAVALSVLGKGTAEEKLKFLFQLYDVDKSGTLTADEIQTIIGQMKEVAKSLGREEGAAGNFIQGLMQKLDKDKNGEIDLNEWVTEGSKTPSLLMLLGIK
eukprot:TRINITY_DN692_c0_g1_i1.p1 TRINITY_DN692_c0_g1~~TRINITY_DN692_c0_g1_i1.p1  ORF type:complete len:187 (-),score=80.77 TRINITY_DN692_c0_g1_i1:81-641(-)